MHLVAMPSPADRCTPDGNRLCGPSPAELPSACTRWVPLPTGSYPQDQGEARGRLSRCVQAAAWKEWEFGSVMNTRTRTFTSRIGGLDSTPAQLLTAASSSAGSSPGSLPLPGTRHESPVPVSAWSSSDHCRQLRTGLQLRGFSPSLSLT